MCIVSRISLISGDLALERLRASRRGCPCTPAYRSVRNVVRPASNATATCVGASSRSRLASIEVNP